MAYRTMAHIHSLKGEMDEITVLEELENNDYIKSSVINMTEVQKDIPRNGFQKKRH